MSIETAYYLLIIVLTVFVVFKKKISLLLYILFGLAPSYPTATTFKYRVADTRPNKNMNQQFLIYRIT